MPKYSNYVASKMTDKQFEALKELAVEQGFYIGNPENGRVNRSQAIRYLILAYMERGRDERDPGESHWQKHKKYLKAKEVA